MFILFDENPQVATVCTPLDPNSTPPQSISHTQEFLRHEANKGDVEAMYLLASFLLVSEDPLSAKKWFQAAAQLGNEDAIWRWGTYFETSAEPTLESVQSFDLLKLAADSGNAKCLGLVGIRYYRGSGVKQDYEAAKKYLTLSDSLRRDKKVLYYLGLLYYHGNAELDEPYNSPKARESARRDAAIELFKLSAKLGFVLAEFQLGKIFATNPSIMDPHLALKYFSKASQAGLFAATCELAALKLAGKEGLEMSIADAFQTLESGAQAGLASALFYLGEV